MSAQARLNLTPPPPAEIEADVADALAEDLGGGDVTADLLPDVADIA
ncbi:nicotinate-nucleotide diphosphorylase, partial [Lysobacter sp. 2RAB21]